MPDQLKMSFDPMTIEHLGVRMYSTLPPVLSELIANSSDADSPTVDIKLNDAGDNKEIVVADTGDGMSFTELNEKFLRIGRNRREDEHTDTTPNGRKVIGKKGLGKLSFFGIASEIEVITRKEGFENVFVMRWEDIKAAGVTGNEYEPTAIRINEPCDPALKGTIITLRGIQRVTDFSPTELATSLSKIFITDDEFVIRIQHNDEEPILVENERKYESLEKEVEWSVPADITENADYLQEKGITGHLIATKTPIAPKTNMRGITLFSRKKLVNLPEYFSDSTSSHFYSYLTGWLEVDFIDDLPEDVIATNRQSLNWDHPVMAELRDKLRGILNWLERDWRKKRESSRQKKLSDTTGINIPDWLSKVPEDVRALLAPLLDAVVKDSELTEEATGAVVRSAHTLVPEYPKYHWRHLHAEIQAIAKDDYVNERYFDAAEKASRLYMQRVKERSGVDSGRDSNDIDSAFNQGDGKLMVTDCADTTKRNIQEGQRLLSSGMVAGFRNPLTHNPEYQKKLIDTGLFTEKDCLDVLSLISHLFRRLDSATVRPDPVATATTPTA